MNKRQAIMKMITDNPHLSVVELSKRTGLSRTVFYKWKAGNFDNIQIKSVQAVADATKTNISIDGDNIEIVDDIIIEKENDMNVEASYIIDLQKDKIETLKKQVDLLKANSYLLDEIAFESEMPTFESWNEIQLLPFKLRNIKISDGFMELNQYLKCPEDIFIQAFKGGGKFHSMEEAPINKLFSKRSKGMFAQKIKDLPALVRQVKDLISNHSMNENVTYEWEGNKVTTFVRTRIDFSSSPILCHSKSTIINGDA